MILHADIREDALRKMIRNRSIAFAGNKNLMIYGKFACRSGKRMKRENRVFFRSEQEAIAAGFRPCGHCLHKQFKEWRCR